MKKLLLILSLIFIVCINTHAQQYKNIEKFRNEKLGIFHTIKSGDLVPFGHFLSFDNYTNNNIRVTYKVTVRVILKKKSTFRDFSYTKTTYINPKSSNVDHFIEDAIMDFINRNSDDIYYENYCSLMLRDFELINFGVEKKNYETSY